MAKTVKYFIEFEAYEYAMSQKMEISKAEYTRQLKFMREQVEKTAIDEDTPVTENEIKVYDNGKTVETIITFQSGCAFTDLIKIECKEGYYFKPKK